MKIDKVQVEGRSIYCLVDRTGVPVPAVLGFMNYMQARGYSPNTLEAYAYDLKHLFTFLMMHNLGIYSFTPRKSFAFLEYLRTLPGRTMSDGQFGLSPFSINRALSAVSMFFEYLIMTTDSSAIENPIQQTFDSTILRVSERYRPFWASL